MSKMIGPIGPLFQRASWGADGPSIEAFDHEAELCYLVAPEAVSGGMPKQDLPGDVELYHSDLGNGRCAILTAAKVAVYESGAQRGSWPAGWDPRNPSRLPPHAPTRDAASWFTLTRDDEGWVRLEAGTLEWWARWMAFRLSNLVPNAVVLLRQIGRVDMY